MSRLRPRFYSRPDSKRKGGATAEAHKDVVRRYSEDFWGGGDADLADELFTADFVDHNPPAPGLPSGPEGQRQVLAVYRSAFPNLAVTTEEMIAEGDRVALRWSARATHEGELLGIPPTGKDVTLSGIDILRIEDGKIAERWAEDSTLRLLQQLGVVTEVAQA